MQTEGGAQSVEIKVSMPPPQGEERAPKMHLQGSESGCIYQSNMRDLPCHIRS